MLLASATLLAAWLAVTFPALAPRTGREVVTRVLLAAASLLVMAPSFGIMRTTTGRSAALLLVTLPSGVLLVSAVTWLLLWVARATPPASR
jgi:hypothetical protein